MPQLMENTFLKSDLVDTIHFLENLSIKEPLDKQRFFRSLQTAMPSFPDVVCTRKLLPLIAAALSYGGAPAIALGSLLKVPHCHSLFQQRCRVSAAPLPHPPGHPSLIHEVLQKPSLSRGHLSLCPC
jgi:hypothetical protein